MYLLVFLFSSATHHACGRREAQQASRGSALQASAGMVSMVDIILRKGPLQSILQNGGLRCAGTLALVSRDTRNATKENLASVLYALREIGVDIGAYLFSAAKNGHAAVVSALLTAGADKNATTQNGITPLDIAAEKGHEVVVSALLAAGADVNAAA